MLISTFFFFDPYFPLGKKTFWRLTKIFPFRLCDFNQGRKKKMI